MLNVLLDGGVQLGKAPRQSYALHHVVRDLRHQLLRGRLLGGDVLLMHLRRGGRELHLQADAVGLRQIFLLIDGLQSENVQVRQLAGVAFQAWLRDGNGDVVCRALPHGFDDNRCRRVRIRTGHAYAFFVLQLLAQYPEQVAKAKHFQRLGSVRAHILHQAHAAANHLLWQNLRLGSKRAQAQHDGDVTNIPALTQHHNADDDLDGALGVINVVCGRTGFLQVTLPYLALPVRVNDQHF